MKEIGDMMGAVWGNNIKLSIFGESHGKGIGINIDGIEPGFKIDFEEIKYYMNKRRPGTSNITTARKEKDEAQILSGIFEGVTTGSPICIFIPNEDKKSKDYSILKEVMRPGHSDYPAYVKYHGYNDVRGGGHFSGRLTAPLVYAGSIAREILKEKGINIYSHIKSIKNIDDIRFEKADIDLIRETQKKEFQVLDDSVEKDMREEILKAKKMGNSVGGTIECMATGVPAGIGNPFFDSLESTISHLMFSIPAVKGIEFGKGFDITRMYGSEANDEYFYCNDKVEAKSNNNGGILGGISNGMPLNITVGIKPTPSIGIKQHSINVSKKENCELQIEGRHDPCIVPRAVVVVESVMALAILDQLKGAGLND